MLRVLIFKVFSRFLLFEWLLVSDLMEKEEVMMDFWLLNEGDLRVSVCSFRYLVLSLVIFFMFFNCSLLVFFVVWVFKFFLMVRIFSFFDSEMSFCLSDEFFFFMVLSLSSLLMLLEVECLVLVGFVWVWSLMIWFLSLDFVDFYLLVFFIMVFFVCFSCFMYFLSALFSWLDRIFSFSFCWIVVFSCCFNVMILFFVFF